MWARSQLQGIGSAALGGIAALYLLAGRWSPERLAGEATPQSVVAEVRLWVVLALAVGALGRWAVRGHKLAARSARWLLAAYLGYLLITALWAPDGNLAIAKAYDVLLVGVATLACVVAADERDVRVFVASFWSTLLALGGVLALLALARALSGGAGERLAVLGGGPNVFGRTMGLFAIASLFAWKKFGRPWIFLPMVAVAVLLLVLTGSRGGFIALACALVCFALLEARSLTKLVMALLVVVAAGWAVVVQTEIGKVALERYERRIQVQLLEERYTSGRDDLYASAVALGVSAPFFGGGLAAFPALGLGVYPHNVFLEAFCEGGAVAVILLLATLAIPMAETKKRRGRVEGASTAGLVLLLVASQFSGDFYDNARGLFLLLVLVLLTPVVTPPQAGAVPARGRRATGGGRTALKRAALSQARAHPRPA